MLQTGITGEKSLDWVNDMSFIRGFITALKGSDGHAAGQGEPANNQESMDARAEGTQ